MQLRRSQCPETPKTATILQLYLKDWKQTFTLSTALSSHYKKLTLYSKQHQQSSGHTSWNGLDLI